MYRLAPRFPSLPLFFLCLLALVAVPSLAAIDFEPVLVDGQIDSRLQGVWKSRGYGWIVDIPAVGSVRLFDYNPEGCLGEDVPGDELTAFARYFVREAETIRITDDVENSTVYTFDHLDAVPEACTEPPAPSPVNVLRHFAGVMADHYVFFETRGVDWQARRASAAAEVTAETGDAELFERLGEMLDGIADGHLRLGGEVDGEQKWVRPGRARLGFDLDAGFERQTRIKSVRKYQRKWVERQRKHVKKLLGRSYRSLADDQVVWGRVGKVGYVGIFGMGGFSADDEDAMETELRAVHSAMAKVVTDLADTESLVVDVTLNGGGFDAVSLAIAGHFASPDRPKTLAFTKVAGDAEGATPQPFFVTPAQPGYFGKPITLLTSHYTVSAAEIFTLAMRALPDVTHRGETTRGALSDVLEKTLLNGWTLSLSNEIYRDSEGVLWEGRGIPPTDPIVVYDRTRIDDSRISAIKEALAHSGERTKD